MLDSSASVEARTLTDIARSSLATSRSRSLSSLSPLMSRLMLEEVRLVSLQLETLRSLLLSPLLRFIMLALSRAHSDSTYLLALGATCLHREEAAWGGGEVKLDLRELSLVSLGLTSILGVEGLEE